MLSKLAWIVTCMTIMLCNYNFCVSLAICHHFWTTLTLMPLHMHMPVVVAFRMVMAYSMCMMELLKMVSSMNTEECPSLTFRFLMGLAGSFKLYFCLFLKVWVLIGCLTWESVYNDVIFILMMMVFMPKLVISNFKFFKLMSKIFVDNISLLLKVGSL